ncbi:hypothetical protein LCGC14_0985130 [marine sediment metagenome]|uniref:Uncharacterized protein n=1 Tax=marine sediment metagenome TaxID=412755 RepID=A0A0F9NTV4_9ZZZZ
MPHKPDMFGFSQAEIDQMNPVDRRAIEALARRRERQAGLQQGAQGGALKDRLQQALQRRIGGGGL